MTYYGFNFTKQNGGGLGAILHDVMNANMYAEQNNLTFCFVKEGYSIPRLNGSIDDVDIPDKTWHSYFSSFPIVEEAICTGIWPVLLPNTRINKVFEEEYSSLLQNKICLFHPDVYDEIIQLVKKTPFNSETDIVLHIRQTDKITENSRFLPLEIYINECEHALAKLNDPKNRIYICTDNSLVCTEFVNHFRSQNIDVVYDNTESIEPLQEIRYHYKLPKSKALAETMNAFKNLFIMKNAKYLIGGRMSYFFRIGELLGYPNKVVNVQDNDLFGVAQYSSVKYHVRPYMKKSILHFVSEKLKDKELVAAYNKTFTENNIVNIKEFVSANVLADIRSDVENYKWWSYATLPNNNVWTAKYEQELTAENIIECSNAHTNGQFGYRFRRSIGKHYSTCICISCKLTETVSSFPITDVLCKIVGCRNMIPGEMFLSNYGKDDFLSIHHDTKKGDIAVTFSLTYDWNPVYGGILHFCDENKDIYKSIVPTLGSVNMFKIDATKGIDHFVSCVNVDKHRYTFTAWYTIVD